jgi:bifunctional DNA-binding transcriptional regulator/antitoxin component of YhaV-PrlF toxin-antitoxin module
MSTFEEVRTVTPDGRLVVPWVIQRALGLEHGGPVRFRVVDGVVTLLPVDTIRPDADGPKPRGSDVRAVLAEELNTLMTTSEPARAKDPVTE